jgi:predicted ABC-type ATPase
MATKEAIVIGGPNGAGKTTAAADLLPPRLHVTEFVNADEIARGISPFNPDGAAVEAGRLMLDRMNALISSGRSFAFETTCAGRGHVRTLRRCHDAGYSLTMLFLWLPSVEMALERVARRVAQGGHRIPDDVVRRRYAAGVRNMRTLYFPAVDTALIYDNSDAGGILIAERRPDAPLVIHDRKRWRLIEEMSQ